MENMMSAEEYLEVLVKKSRKAQQEFETLTQEEVDMAVRAIGKAEYDHANVLAKMAIEETGLGDYKSRVAKCMEKSTEIWYDLKG